MLAGRLIKITHDSFLWKKHFQNAADAMTFLEKQATNFLNQWRRIQSFNKTINGKLSKNGVFANVTGYLLTALGDQFR